MTNNHEKRVDGWCAWHPERGWCPPSSMESFEDCDVTLTSNNRAMGWSAVPIRIIPASEPTAAEARAEVIAEVRQAIADERLDWSNVDHEELVEDALTNILNKLRELEARGRG